MSISSLKFLYIVQKTGVYNADVKSSVDYPRILERIRNTIAQHHADELSRSLGSDTAAEMLRELVFRYCVDEVKDKNCTVDISKLSEQVFLDMASVGFLNEYLHDPTVEEINIDRFDLVEIIYNDHIKYLYGPDAFRTPQDAVDTVKRLVRMGGFLLDATTPQVDSYIGDGTRISAKIPPAVPLEYGVTASIRKQSKANITREQIISSDAVAPEALDFLVMCLCNNISVGIAGSTGSGKTTDEAFLLNEYITNNQDYNNRVYVIEDSRELNLINFDVVKNRPARVIYTTTKPAPNPITMLDQVKDSLRYHPKLIVPAEVRDAAAYEAASAGQTGHTILTTLHADDAIDAYYRLLTMCNMALSGLSEERLLSMCIKAWPIMVYKKQLRDNSRKYMQIFEAVGHKNGKVYGNMLFSYEIAGYEYGVHGNCTIVRGSHKKSGCISPILFRRLVDNGVDAAALYSMFPELEDNLSKEGRCNE